MGKKSRGKLFNRDVIEFMGELNGIIVEYITKMSLGIALVNFRLSELDECALAEIVGSRMSEAVNYALSGLFVSHFPGGPAASASTSLTFRHSKLILNPGFGHRLALLESYSD